MCKSVRYCSVNVNECVNECREPDMNGKRICQGLLLLLSAALLAACLPETSQIPRQVQAEWPEQHLLFIADSRMGRVNAFFLGNGAPIYFARTKHASRASVRDLQLDALRGQLWVLGDDGVSVYEARHLELEQHIPVNTQDISALRLEADTVMLLGASGEPVGQVDRRAFAASRRFPVRRG